MRFTYIDSIPREEYQSSLEGIDRLVYVKTLHIKHLDHRVLLIYMDLGSGSRHKPLDLGIQYHADILLFLL